MTVDPPRLQKFTAPKEWTAEIILPDNPNSYDNMCLADKYPNPLPNDGLPRITLEGLDILAEGLRGDFHRWRWGIGNHPLEMPVEHLRNMTIHCMKDEPHFIASFWFGTVYPVVGYRNMTPWVPFDTLDLQQSQYREEHPDTVKLGDSEDWWAHISVQVGDAYLWDDKARRKWAKEDHRKPEEDEEDQEDTPEEEEPACPAIRPRNTTLDAWMGAQ